MTARQAPVRDRDKEIAAAVRATDLVLQQTLNSTTNGSFLLKFCYAVCCLGCHLHVRFGACSLRAHAARAVQGLEVWRWSTLRCGA